jgi:hypothetical protein
MARELGASLERGTRMRRLCRDHAGRTFGGPDRAGPCRRGAADGRVDTRQLMPGMEAYVQVEAVPN